MAALVILVFFTFYVSSGMVAAGKFFVSSFGWNYFVGMFVVALITLAYTLFGGFLGATLTDVAQGLLMLAALIAVPIVTVVELGGWSEATDRIADVKHEAFNLFSGFSGNAFVWIVATISTAAWGLGYFGQPHIIVRFMALRSPGEAKTARRISLFWMVLTASGAIFTAFIGIGYFAGSPEIKLGKNESEEVFLVMSRIFFHPFVAGLVLAAVLAVLGYSVNESVIIFDRVREKFRERHARNMTTAQVLDHAITTTTSRTVITHTSTLMMVLSMLFFGGPTLHYFSLALAIGICFGVYSSIFVAAAIVMRLGLKREDLVKPVKKKDATEVELP